MNNYITLNPADTISKTKQNKKKQYKIVRTFEANGLNMSKKIFICLT